MTSKSSSRSAKAGQIAIAIMAAGKGTRLKSKHPKVLHKVGGKWLLARVIETASKVVAPEHIYVIIGHEAERVRAAVDEMGVQFILQAEQRGTGHAIMTAETALLPYETVLVLSGDVPLIRPETMRELLDFHQKRNAAMTILTAEPREPMGYGRVIRKAGGEVASIVEQKALTAKQAKVREINSGIYAFAAHALFDNIHQLGTDNAHHEFYLTDMASILGKARKKVVALKAEEPSEVLGANTMMELASLDAWLRARKCAELMSNGVVIYRPDTCVIDDDVQVAADTEIQPYVQLLGKTKIGADCQVRSFSVISNSEIADGVVVRPGCVLDEARVATGAVLGPYSHLRPGSEIGEGAHVGNFVETKKAKVGKGSKANHLTYLGDAEIGEGVNIGAGTITCNYDGVNKHQTTIEDGVFVGSDTTLVAPVKVGRGAYIGASSCITDDVEADALAIGRARQISKPGWAREKRAQQAAAKSSKTRA